MTLKTKTLGKFDILCRFFIENILISFQKILAKILRFSAKKKKKFPKWKIWVGRARTNSFVFWGVTYEQD